MKEIKSHSELIQNFSDQIPCILREIKYHSELIQDLGDQIPCILRENFRRVAQAERDRVAELVQSLADGSEDAVQKNILEEVATAIRRLPNAY